MVDILLTLPDDLIADFEREASLQGTTAEELMGEAIAIAASQYVQRAVTLDRSDEPIITAAEIEQEARRLGYKLGWRFMTCPQRNAGSAKLLFVTLNPGGRESDDCSWSYETGSAYRIESWEGAAPGQSKLQKQVQAMFQFLGLGDEDVFSAYYVPFRSPSWKELERRDEAEMFARRLWDWLLPQVTFERVVCIGKDTARAIAPLLEAKFETSVSINWGNVVADRYRLPDGRPLFALPHLSRFAVFGRAKSEAGLKELFNT